MNIQIDMTKSKFSHGKTSFYASNVFENSLLSSHILWDYYNSFLKDLVATKIAMLCVEEKLDDPVW